MLRNPNYVILYEGLKIFRDTMLAFIREQLKHTYGDSWWEQGVVHCFKGEDIDRIRIDFEKRQASLVIERPGNELVEMLDASRFGNIIGYKHNWNNVFRSTFGESNKNKVLGWLDEIREVRNSVAHPETGDLRTDDAFRCLDHADRILRLIKADTAHEVQRLKRSLISPKTDQELSPLQSNISNHWLEYCHNLLSTHQDWTTMPPALYLSSEQMDIAPARVISDQEQSKEFRLQSIPIIERALKDFEPVVIKNALRGILESSSSETKDLLSLVDESDRPIVLLGHPGLGKSVAMERLALKYAEHYLEDKTNYVPVLIQLRNYDSHKRDLRNWIRIKLQNQEPALSEVDTGKILQAQKLLLLFDGLDEASKDSDILPELETFIEEYPHHRYVISSRLNVYRGGHSRIIGCREVELQELTFEEAASLWRSFVDEPDFSALPEKIQNILYIPLLLRLCTEIPQPTLVKVKTEIQVMDLIVRNISKPLKLPAKNREIVERCLFRLALAKSYALDREQIFDVVTERLAGESIAYQQDITTSLFDHPLLISTDNYVSFWHPVFKDYFAARGLKDALFRQNHAASDLHYLNDPHWDDTIVYLAQLLDGGELARLINYLLLDFDNHILALRCIRERPSPPERVIEMVIGGLATAIVTTIEEVSEEVSLERLGDFLLANVVTGHTPKNLSQAKLTKLLLYVDHLRQGITDFKLPVETYLEPYLQDVLLSREIAHRLIGLYWLYQHLRTSEITFSNNFIAGVAKRLNPDSAANTNYRIGMTEMILIMRTLHYLLPVIEGLAKQMEEQGHFLQGWQGVETISFWEAFLQTPESDPSFSFFHTAAGIGLSRLEEDRALELLVPLLDHPEAQVRLVAVFGLLNRRQYQDIAGKMIHDPNPIVAHVATRYLLPFPDETSGHQFRLMIENLITPLTGKVSEEMLFSFTEFMALSGRLNFLANPYVSQTELNFLGHGLLDQGAMSFGYFVDQSNDKEDKIAALLAGITTQIWVVGLVASGKVSLPASTAPSHAAKEISEEIEQTEERLARIKITDEGRLYTYFPELFELTDDNIAYIKSWTDHEVTREIAEEVLTGHYKPRLKGGEIKE